MISKEVILRVENIESYYGPIMALKGVSLQVQKGSIVSVLGANGAGKTTLMKNISGVMDPEKGRIFLENESVEGTEADILVRKGVAHVPEGREVFPMLTVEQNLLMGAYTTELKSFDLYDPKWEETTFSAFDPDLQGNQEYLTLSAEEIANVGEIGAVPSRVIWQLKDTGVQPGGDTDEQLDKSKEENFDLSNIYNQSIMRYQQLFSSTITITVAGDFSLHAGDAIWVDIAGLKADTEADDINEKDGGVYIISDLSHYVSLKETYTKMNLIRDSTGRKGSHNTFRKGTNAHTIMQDGFAANIK